MNKKAAIELSANFLVIIIISLVILSSAILITRQVFRGTKELHTDLDTQTEAQIEALLEEGRPVAVAFNRKSIKRGEDNLFGVGILNLEDKQSLSLDVSFNKAFDKNEEEIENVDGDDWLFYLTDSFEIERNGDKKIGVLFEVPKDALFGEYIFNVKALREDGSQYGDLQKIYVVVIS